MKPDGSLAASLQTVNDQVLHAGWQRALMNNQTNDDVNEVLAGESRQSASYVNPKGFSGTRAYLAFYKNSASENDGGSIQQLISSGKLKAPSVDKYIIGIYVSASYWSCNNDSLLKICPLPPGR